MLTHKVKLLKDVIHSVTRLARIVAGMSLCTVLSFRFVQVEVLPAEVRIEAVDRTASVAHLNQSFEFTKKSRDVVKLTPPMPSPTATRTILAPLNSANFVS